MIVYIQIQTWCRSMFDELSR